MKSIINLFSFKTKFRKYFDRLRNRRTTGSQAKHKQRLH